MKKKDPWFTEIVRVVSWIVFLATIESIHETTRKGTKEMQHLCSDLGRGDFVCREKNGAADGDRTRIESQADPSALSGAL
jgi:hypothetical protein